ncbi:MAG TPA: hypothetical protein VFI68_04395 [Anaerolineales bacterium]|nr:hypothetical protein [Anaerolineales bacterium]
MNKRREAMLWSITITSAIALGLVVVWMAITMAFGQQNLAPLHFVAAPYRQDDYSAESQDMVRLNPLDENLEQEVILEEQANSSFLLNPDGKLPLASSTPTNIPQTMPTNTPPSTLTNIPATSQQPNTPKPPKTPKPPNPNQPPPNPNKTPNPHKP